MALPAHIKAAFPGLIEPDADQTSNNDKAYNCISHAAGDSRRRWWEPAAPPGAYWPKGVVREYTLDAYRSAFESVGYFSCKDDSLETGFEKIAIFMSPTQSSPTHAARQLEDGLWTSKLGPKEDIKHPLRQLEGRAYGMVSLLMKRKRGAKI